MISIDIYSYEVHSNHYRIRPLDEEFLMTYDSDSPTGQAYLTDAVLWLVGTPLAILDVLYLAYGAPPITPNAPETLVVWVLGLIALALLAWNLLSSACAHLATLRHVPDPLRRAAHLLVSRFGTRLSRSLLARAGASALIGSALVTSVPLGGALAAPQDTGPRGVSLTWADSPEIAAHTSPEASPTTSADAESSTAQDTDAPGASLTWADTPTSTLATSPGSTEATPASAPGLTGTRDPGDAPSPPEVPDPAFASRATTDMPETVTVATGDSLWSIAASLQPGSDDAHITRMWRAIHAANSHAIPNPSLIYPGQTLTIPQDQP